MLSVWNTGRALALGQQLPIIQPLATVTEPWLWLGVAMVWAAVFLGTAVALWQQRPFVRLWLPTLLGLYAFTEIGFALQATAVAPTAARIAALLLVYGALLLFSSWALNRQSVRWYFTQSSKKEEADHGR